MQIGWQGENLIIKSRNTCIMMNHEIKINDFVIDEDGEFEIGGISLKSVNDINLLHIENMVISYISKLEGHKLEQIENSDELTQADVMIINLKDFTESSKKNMNELISIIDPSCLMILCFDDNIQNEMSKEFNVSAISETKLTATDLPEEGRSTILLSCPTKS